MTTEAAAMQDSIELENYNKEWPVKANTEISLIHEKCDFSP
jgi:hypothetical protein